jgi:hypothetical protein
MSMTILFNQTFTGDIAWLLGREITIKYTTLVDYYIYKYK